MSKQSQQRFSNLKDYLVCLPLPTVLLALFLGFKALAQFGSPASPHRHLIGATGAVACVAFVLIVSGLLYWFRKRIEIAGLKPLALERLLRYAGQCLLNNHQSLSEDDRSAAQDSINTGLYRLYSRPYTRNTSSMMYDSRPADVPLARQLADATFAILGLDKGELSRLDRATAEQLRQIHTEQINQKKSSGLYLFAEAVVPQSAEYCPT